MRKRYPPTRARVTTHNALIYGLTPFMDWNCSERASVAPVIISLWGNHSGDQRRCNRLSPLD